MARTGTASRHPSSPAERATFKLATRSAVSRSVSWLIWSTIPEILGLAAAASVELCRRAMRCWSAGAETARTDLLLAVARSWRAQHWAAYLHESDILWVGGGGRPGGGRVRVRSPRSSSSSSLKMRFGVFFRARKVSNSEIGCCVIGWCWAMGWQLGPAGAMDGTDFRARSVGGHCGIP